MASLRSDDRASEAEQNPEKRIKKISNRTKIQQLKSDVNVLRYAAESRKVTKGMCQMLEFVLKISASGGFYKSTGPTSFHSRNSTKEQACSPFLSKLNACCW